MVQMLRFATEVSAGPHTRKAKTRRAFPVPTSLGREMNRPSSTTHLISAYPNRQPHHSTDHHFLSTLLIIELIRRGASSIDADPTEPPNRSSQGAGE